MSLFKAFYNHWLIKAQPYPGDYSYNPHFTGGENKAGLKWAATGQSQLSRQKQKL